MRRKIKAFWYRLIRPLFVRNIDPNEEFSCMHCGEPVLKRYLYCSTECAEKDPFWHLDDCEE